MQRIPAHIRDAGIVDPAVISGSSRWHSWTSLERRTHITLEWTTFDDDRMGTCDCHDDGTVTITLDERLTVAETTSTLVHEMIHAERGILGDASEDDPWWWRALVAHEEQLVDNETARRLVPHDELEQWIDEHEAFSADEIAEAFRVPVWVALDALRLR